MTYGLTVFGKRKAEGSAGAAEVDEDEGTANGTQETGQQVINSLAFWCFPCSDASVQVEHSRRGQEDAATEGI